MQDRIGLTPFSQLEASFDRMKEDAEIGFLRNPVEPYTALERSKKETVKRIMRVVKDYWTFDETYFTSEMYFGGRAEPNQMLKDIVKLAWSPKRRTQTEIKVFLGPRKYGKTVTLKKVLVWLLMTGRVKMAGTYAETMLKSCNIMRDLTEMIRENDRLCFDFYPEFVEDNDDQCEFRCTPHALKDSKIDSKALFGTRYLAAFAEGRSLRGYTRKFQRPEFILGDDVETLESSFSPQAVTLRLNKLSEAMHSMEDGSVFMLAGNDIDTRGAMHQLRLEQEQGVIAKEWRVFVYKAWDKGKGLWPERYPAESEAELKRLLAPRDEADYQANYQMNPVPPDGVYFTRDHYREEDVPGDARGILWCDPNLSKKSKGDTTCVLPLLYSPSTDLFYIPSCISKSFSDSNDLLDAILSVKRSTKNITGLGFDGNVSQESTWTNNVRNYCRLKKQPFPGIEYKKYRVDDLAKNAQLVYAANRVRFAPGFAKTPDGERFLVQFFAFSGKSANATDDAPDAFISALEFLTDRGIAGRRIIVPTKSITDYYSFK